MVTIRPSALAVSMPPVDSTDWERDACASASDRRAYLRVTPEEMKRRLTARHKYGDPVDLVAISAGGALLDTPRFVRPDSDVVLEIFDAATRTLSPVVSRVLRARVARVSGGVTYRAACAFKRPLGHPLLRATPQTPSTPEPVHEYLKLELALKTIVEGYFGRPSATSSAGRWRDEASLIQALIRLRAAAARRRDPVDRSLADFLAALIPALERHESNADLLKRLHDQLARPHLHLCPTVNCAAPERLLMPMSRLKAVFFVKNLEGNKERVDDQAFDHAPRGRKVQVTFRDGEVITGSTLNYKPNAHGFFVQPANSYTNNIRIYVVTPAVRHLRFV